MKQFFSVNNTTNATNIALLIARVGIAALMLTHGIPKLGMLLSGDPVQFPPVMGMRAELSLTLAVFAEVICSLLILAGFGTRLAVQPLIVTMVVAVLLIHSADPFAVKELAMIHLLVYIVLFFAGSGKYSLDGFLQQRKRTDTYERADVKNQSIAA